MVIGKFQLVPILESPIRDVIKWLILKMRIQNSITGSTTLELRLGASQDVSYIDHVRLRLVE